MLLAAVSYGQTYTTTTTGGNWTTGGTWVGGSAPASWQNYSAVINGDVQVNTTSINGFTSILLNGGKSFNRGTSGTSSNLSMQSVTFTVNNGNITIYGNLTLDNTSLTITSGNLDVRGTLTITNGGSLTFNSSGTISAKAFATAGSGGTLDLNNGSMSVTNALTVASGGSINIASGKSLSAGSMTINSGGTFTNNGTTAVSGSVTQQGALTVNNGSTFTVTNNFSSSSSATTNTAGAMTIGGNVSVQGSAKLQINPGAATKVNGNVTVYSNENLIVGTNVAPPPYADLAVLGNVILENSGDLTINQNGRFGVKGDLQSNNGGGVVITVNNGGQAYVNGDLQLDGGGGNSIINNNSVDPFGLYVKGNVDNNRGGSSTTTNLGDENTLQTNTSFYNWIQNQLFGVLPIKLLFFDASVNTDNTVTIQWATSKEEAFDHFEIQRASSEFVFQTIATVAGAGYNTNSRENYEATDNLPLSGDNYYRLKAVDLDGSFEYFPVTYISISQSRTVEVYPNPVVGKKINLALNFTPSETDSIVLMDMAGNKVATGDMTAFTNELTLDDSVKPGMYILKYTSGSFDKTIRISIQ